MNIYSIYNTYVTYTTRSTHIYIYIRICYIKTFYTIFIRCQCVKKYIRIRDMLPSGIGKKWKYEKWKGGNVIKVLSSGRLLFFFFRFSPLSVYPMTLCYLWCASQKVLYCYRMMEKIFFAVERKWTGFHINTYIYVCM